MVRTALLAALVLAMPALAQDDDRTVDPLAGPSVSESSGATLIEREFSGRIRRTEIPPEEAALALLALSAQEKTAAARVLTERAAILDRIVLGNIELLLQLATASAAGERAEQGEILAKLGTELEPLRDRGPLADELAGALTEDNARRLRSLVREYWSAVVQEGVADARKQGQTLRPGQVVAREMRAAVGQEIRRSYERQVTARVAELDRQLAAMGLSPEQEGKIRNMVTEYAQKTRLSPTDADRRRLFAAIMGELSPEQRRAFVKQVLGR